jgi:SAM-dependent methyltransferase
MIVPNFVQKNAAEYHLNLMKAFLDRVDVRGKRVMEIGSDYYLASARLLCANGAAEVVSTNLGNWRSPDPLPEGIRFHVVNACETGFPDSSFDLIYGIAVLEHIPEMEPMCQEIRRMLKPGGKAYLQGCPFWSCSVGHHVWYDRKDGTLYAFTNDSNPIAHWSHLVLTPSEMKVDLHKRGLPGDDAAAIVNYVFDLNGQSTGSASNRQLPSDTIGRLSSHFGVDIIERYHDTTPENEYYFRAAGEFGEGDLKTMGFSVLLER